MTDILNTSSDLPGDDPGSLLSKQEDDKAGYRVLARKYRPTNFKQLIGQAALVRTLSNAIDSGRIAHAFILTGVRGVGKTTTARIIARALNCTGHGGEGGPTIDPCGVCDNCQSISEDRHVDVIEMDAASRTGIDDVRELIEGVRYRPVSARYKVYIIDEVHMLSRQAFNGLLKTLEEPPEHVIFIFATTEIRRVPVTVLSRCQRFDLRRVDMAELTSHFKNIAKQESVGIEDEAVAIIARAADGSVRDGLSLLDQAIALAGGTVTAEQIRDMLGLADRNAVFDLFDQLMSGDIAGALDRFETMYRDGADPVIVLQDLLDVTYWLTRVKVAPIIAEASGVPEAERTRGAAMAASLPMPVLTRNWQMLLKGLGETQHASVPMQAAEMTLIRIAYAADVPPPADLVRKLQKNGANAQTQPVPSAPPQPSTSPPTTPMTAQIIPVPQVRPELVPDKNPDEGQFAAPVFDPDDDSGGDLDADIDAPVEMVESAPPANFKAAVKLFEDNREGILTKHLRHDLHLVRYEIGNIEFRPTEFTPKDMANKLSQHLSTWTGMRWMVSVSQELGDPTLAEQQDAFEAEQLKSAESHPLVDAVRSHFPGATVNRVTVRDTAMAENSTGAKPDLAVPGLSKGELRK
ncbi:MAG: DNA polymerase III subunit gamma/tau [Alphaproteobacteria bacterium]|jgi:DNA polymerase-3 subunit gamma/tau